MEGGGCHTFGPPTVTLFERREQVAKRIEKPTLFDLKTFGDYLVSNNGELTMDQVEEIFEE